MNSESAIQAGRALLRVAGLVKEYPDPTGKLPVLRGIDLEVRRGEMLAIMGPSGSGKSTLLFILGLLLPPTAGTYVVDETDVLNLDRAGQAAFRRKTVGFVFQSCNLVENTTVYENLEFPLVYAGVPRNERPARIHEALRKVSLDHRLHHRTNHLSGGEQQRVAIARALANRPKIILADEPTGQLDRSNSEIVLDYFQQCAADGDKAVVVVTHDPAVAARCTRVCRIEDGLVVPEARATP